MSETVIKKAMDPAGLELRQNYKLLIGAIAPRPIAWISSVSADGLRNLAPFSYFMAVSHRPPMLAVSINVKGTPATRKDTLQNIEATREFVVNVATLATAVQMNQSSGEYPPDVDEFEYAGVTPVPSDVVKAPCVAESPINIECRVVQISYLGEPGFQAGLIVGEIVRWHIAEHLLTPDGGIDVTQVEAISRLSYDNYGYPVTLFSRPRPQV